MHELSIAGHLIESVESEAKWIGAGREHRECGRSGKDFQCPRCRRVGEITSAGGELLLESLKVGR